MLLQALPSKALLLNYRTLAYKQPRVFKQFMSRPSQSPLLETSAPKTPKELADQWIQDAKDASIPLPTVASLASASLPSGRVSNRMVNIKELNSSGNFVVYSDFHESRKGKDIHSNDQVALTFYWQQLDRSIRVEGKLKLLSKEESRPYFKSRSPSFQASVLVGEQSKPVEGGRNPLLNKYKEISGQSELDIPDWWTGAEIEPDWVEFWQGNSDRISDRLAYSRNEQGEWILDRLSP